MAAEGDTATADIADMSTDEVLDFATVQHAARHAADRALLRAAHHWAVLHHPEDSYAAATFGARIQTSPYGAQKLIADAVDLHHRLPRLWAGIEHGVVRVSHARHVASATRDLTATQAAQVDTAIAPVADGRLAWTRFQALVEGHVAAAAPDLAEARERAAALERGIRVARVNKHGIATLTIRDHAATIHAADAALSTVADALQSRLPDAPPAERRLAAFALLTHPAAHRGLESHLDLDAGPLKPKVSLYLHLTPDSPVARLEDHGPVTASWVRELTSHLAGTVTVRPVIDLNQGAAVDAYEIPARLREAVRLIHPADVFPYAAHLSRRVDLDHQIPYRTGGTTSTDNLAPLTRTHHRIKTHAGWQARQPFPGILIWRDPLGAHYLVDNTGTRRISTSGADQAATPAEIHATGFVLDYLAA